MSFPVAEFVLHLKTVNRQNRFSFLKDKHEATKFEGRPTFMLCAHLISPGPFHWSKGFLNKGSHWPIGANHVHTDILLLAIP